MMLEQMYNLVGTMKNMKNFDKDWRMFTWKFQKVIGNYLEYALVIGRKRKWNA